MSRPTAFPFLLFVALEGVSLAGSSRYASAADLRVRPVRLELKVGTTSGVATVHNQGDDVLHLAVSAFAWSQRRDGEMELSPTNDIIFSPASFSLEPGGTRSIRVGSATQFAGREKTYRLVIEEQPAVSASEEGPSSKDAPSRMTIPVFLEPDREAPLPIIQPVSIERGGLKLTIENSGTSRFVAGSVSMRGTTANGRVVIEHKLPGGYVLAGGAREWEVPLGAACDQLARIDVELSADGRSYRATFARPKSGCAKKRSR